MTEGLCRDMEVRDDEVGIYNLDEMEFVDVGIVDECVGDVVVGRLRHRDRIYMTGPWVTERVGSYK